MKSQKSIISILMLFFLMLTVNIPVSKAAVPRTISIQGKLTNTAGIPITGVRNITLRIYSETDEIVCESVQAVSADNGLFNTEITTCTNTDIDGKDLFLGIQVEGDAEMTPRQQLKPVPYAFSLVPGAKIAGTTPANSALLTVDNGDIDEEGARVGNGGNGIEIAADDYGLYVKYAGRDGVWVDQVDDDGFYVSDAGGDGLYVGTAAGNGVYVGSAGSHGVYARSDSTTGRGVFGWANTESGENYGVYGRSDSPDGYGVYGYNNDDGGIAIMADGTGIIKSVADTEITASPLNMVIDTDHSHPPSLETKSYGYTALRPTAIGTNYAYVPVTIPSLLFGVTQKLKSIRVCCKMDTADSYLTGIEVANIIDNGSRDTLYSDDSNRTNTDWACYTSTNPTPSTIDGSVLIKFDLYSAGIGADHDISIGKITLTLTEI